RLAAALMVRHMLAAARFSRREKIFTHAPDSIMPSRAILPPKSKATAVKRQAKNHQAKNHSGKNHPAKHSPSGRKAAVAKSGVALGALPEWNLADLYAGLDDPAVKRDLDRIDAECLAFEETYKGKLAELAQSPQAGS